MKKVNIETKPVAWSGETVLKFQSFARLDNKVIAGEPMPTPEEALDSLKQTINEWLELLTNLSKNLLKNV
ncbi:MAG: hypothetical protein IJ588_06240 [Prevotella sp.]|nr:hypothetical protein [Prevotella sp.]